MNRSRRDPLGASANSILFVVCLFLLGTLMAGCQTSDPGSNEPPVAITIVYPPELSEYMRLLKSSFEGSEHRLAGGIRVTLNLREERALEAARKIANGEIKAEAWMAPSTSLVNYTNGHIINLGAPQVDCRPLFGSPMVVVTAASNLSAFDAKDQVFSWSDFLSALTSRAAADQVPIESQVSFHIANPDFAASGVPTVLQLAYFALGNVEGTISVAALQSPEFKKRFVASFGMVSRLVPTDERLLDELQAIEDSRLAFGLLTERQLVTYNAQRGGAKGSLVALYPREGSVWQDYSLCLSDSDWVLPPQRAGVALLGSYLTARSAQAAAARIGFRPVAKDPELLKGPLRPELGVRPDAASAAPLPFSSNVVEQLLAEWSTFVRPMATLVVLDLSGTTGQGPLYSGIRMVKFLAQKRAKRDEIGLMTFADRVKLEAPLSTDSSRLDETLSQLAAGGGSALYQSIHEALELAAKDRYQSFRRNIVIFTDGRDNKSRISLDDLIDTIKYRKRHMDFNLLIVATVGSGVDLSDLDRIADAAGGAIWKVPLNEVERVVAEMHARYW